jgi:hypothetical protein
MVEIGGVDGLITPLNICYTPESGRASSGLRESVVDPLRTNIGFSDKAKLAFLKICVLSMLLQVWLSNSGAQRDCCKDRSFALASQLSFNSSN